METSMDETLKNKEQLINQASGLHKRIQRKEKIAEYLLIIETIMIISISATQIEFLHILVKSIKNIIF